MSHPPMQPSNSPNGLSRVDAPRRGESYGQVSMAESVVLSHGPPASSTVTLTPARVRAYAAIPPPAPEPTTSTSTGDDWVATRIQGSLVAECTAGVAWVSDTDPPARGSLYGGDDAASSPPLFYLMSHRLQLPHGRVGQTAVLVVRLVRQRLMVNARGGNRVREAHLLIEHVKDDLRNTRDDRRTAGRADDHLQIARTIQHDRGRHRRQHPLVAGHGVSFALDEPVHVRLARRGREVVHLVVEQESRARHRHAAAESAVQRRG